MPKKILVVDDSATLRASVNYTLKEAGFETINAVNGADGLEKLNQAMKSGEQIGMIISDINMPVMDGITFITEVKKTPFKSLLGMGSLQVHLDSIMAWKK